KEAIKHFEAALTFDQKPTTYFHLARAYDAAGENSQKLSVLNTAQKMGLKKEALHPTEWADYDRLTTLPKDDRTR
ncbi:MAG: hypothetical protein ACRCZF_17555, partial [Gemmataceae bacterium]